MKSITQWYVCFFIETAKLQNKFNTGNAHRIGSNMGKNKVKMKYICIMFVFLHLLKIYNNFTRVVIKYH